MSDIAPHEGIEWKLVLEGTKPFAVIEFRKDPEQCVYVVNNPDLYDFETVVGFEGRELQFWKKDNPDGKLAQIKYTGLIQNADMFIVYHGKDWYTREMGKIFGYTDEQINAFISGDIKCNCTKCKGMSRNG